MSNLTQDITGYFKPDACDLDEFLALIDQSMSVEDVPHAAETVKNVPIYDMARLRSKLEDQSSRKTLMAEWAKILRSGPGVVVLRGACTDLKAIDDATQIFERIIAEEKAIAGGGADHFAAAGANDRIWNSLQKLCEAAPDVFLRYFASTPIDAVCEAWLGPNYQMTAQVNVVHPGGAAQLAHRDYHLGFQSEVVSADYPAHVHDLSPVLTLQGAVAHCDMPLESGPTKLLPFSQTYRAGYAAWRRDDFRAAFEERCIQLPLAKGDGLFFNPALFHAAGANTTSDIHRMANLLQVSSAFGRALEAVNRSGMCKMLYPHAMLTHMSNVLNDGELRSAIAACAEGYSFPTNLDNDPPEGGLAPETQQAFFLRAIAEGMSPDDFSAHLDAMRDKQLA